MDDEENYEIDNDIEMFDDLNKSLGSQVNQILEDNKYRDNKRKKLKRRIWLISGLAIMLVASVLFGKKLVVHMIGNSIYDKLEIDTASMNNREEMIVTEDKSNNITNFNTEEKYLQRNILLLGVEEFEGAKNTDAIIIASINTKDNTLKLTSLMRDLYVEIQGYENNKLNSVYAKGGIDLLYNTIESNFGIRIDGYVMVNYNALENIVDQLDGIEIKLTKGEAKYLNTKNYISDPANRNVMEGTQTLNGNQVLGYCRVRYVSTGSESDDFGRTQRHRVVLNSIFNKVKQLNIVEMASFMYEILEDTNITTDISKKDFNKYIEEALDIITKIQISEYRIPSNGTFENKKIKIGSLKRAVLVPNDWNVIREDIRNFIYGSE
ncbi:MAG: cell envelope-related transcriptional attenuator [Herbinix sp.]|jgi:LCP family protein required for cell wall assembly|nr:cell envelope-related transcriptional attenuator [Herbinix sp.]